MARRRITIDTQVFSLLSEASDDKWRQRFWRVLDQQYRCIISPLSMFELFFGRLPTISSRTIPLSPRRIRSLPLSGLGVLACF